MGSKIPFQCRRGSQLSTHFKLQSYLALAVIRVSYLYVCLGL